MNASLLQPCPECGSGRLAWRVLRRGSLSSRWTTELRWNCRGCTHEWAEPLLAAPVAEASPAPPVQTT